MAAAAGSGGGAPQWCKGQALLGSMFGFNHLPCSSLQTQEDVNGFCRILESFVGSLNVILCDAQWLSYDAYGESLESLQLSSSFLCSRFSSSGGGVEWFPAYGCALLALPPHCTQAAPHDVTVTLVGLDAWEFRLHSRSDGGTQHTAACNGVAVLPVGALPARRCTPFLTTLLDLLAEAQKRTKDERSSQGSTRQGHQMTPAMIHAVALQALEQVKSGVDGGGEEGQPEKAGRPPRGGFTDVGLHTGGTSRDTAWPLARQTFKVVLEHAMSRGDCSSSASSSSPSSPPPNLFRLTLAHLIHPQLNTSLTCRSCNF